MAEKTLGLPFNIHHFFTLKQKGGTMHLACTIIALAIALPLCAQKNAMEPFADLAKLKWKTFVGQTTYRTNIVHYGDKLIIGSNGHHYKDYALDSDNGVYILDAATGRALHHLAHENLGDMDVNGVVADGNRVYFGSDNDEFHCYHLTGEKVWTVPVSGDVEVVPLLLDVDADGAKDVIFATESGEVGALSGLDGKYLWSFKIKDFTGWKKTQNRFVFKVGDWFRNGSGFMAAPLLADLNSDGQQDIVAAARDGNLYALNGATGKLLWRVSHGGYLSQPPVLRETKGTAHIYFMGEGKEEDGWKQRLYCVDGKGQTVFRSRPLSGIQNSFQPAVFGNEMVLAGWDSMFVINLLTGHVRSGKLDHPKASYNSHYFTAQPLLLDLMKLGAPQLVLMGQGGSVTMMDWKGMVRLREYRLPSGTEASPLLTDVDCDGRLDVLISAYDGYLYCFSTGIPEKTLAYVSR